MMLGPAVALHLNRRSHCLSPLRGALDFSLGRLDRSLEKKSVV
jgi:hypothetical protein